MSKKTGVTLLLALCVVLACVLVWCVARWMGGVSDAVTTGSYWRVRAHLLLKPGLLESRDSFDRPLLHQAVAEGHAEVVGVLLSAGADVDATDVFGLTPLHWAARMGHSEGTQRLLSAGADVNARDKRGRSPLHHAVQNKHPDVVERLLQQGASINVEDDGGWSALHRAAVVSRDEAMCSLLLTKGAETDIFSAAALGKADRVRSELERNPALVGARASNDYTLLHIAAQTGNEELAELLLSKGAHVSAQSVPCVRAIHLAARFGHSGLVEMLLGAGADVDAGADGGATPLLEASRGRHTEAAEVLLAHGASVSGEPDRVTPLHCWAAAGNEELLQLLLARGADVNAQDDRGRTPMNLASAHESVLGLLKENGGKMARRIEGMVCSCEGAVRWALERAEPAALP